MQFKGTWAFWFYVKLRHLRASDENSWVPPSVWNRPNNKACGHQHGLRTLDYTYSERQGLQPPTWPIPHRQSLNQQTQDPPQKLAKLCNLTALERFDFMINSGILGHLTRIPQSLRQSESRPTRTAATNTAPGHSPTLTLKDKASSHQQGPYHTANPSTSRPRTLHKN